MLFAILSQEQMGNDIECVEYIVGMKVWYIDYDDLWGRTISQCGK
jgi:hypothetical protein